MEELNDTTMSLSDTGNESMLSDNMAEHMAGDLEVTMRNQIIFEETPSPCKEEVGQSQSHTKRSPWQLTDAEKEPLAGDLEMSLRSQIMFDRFQIPPPPWISKDGGTGKAGLGNTLTNDNKDIPIIPDLSVISGGNGTPASERDSPTEQKVDDNETVEIDKGIIIVKSQAKGALPSWVKPETQDLSSSGKIDGFSTDVPVLMGSVKRLAQCFESMSSPDSSRRNSLEKSWRPQRDRTPDRGLLIGGEEPKNSPVSSTGRATSAPKIVVIEELGPNKDIGQNGNQLQTHSDGHLQSAVADNQQKFLASQEEVASEQQPPSSGVESDLSDEEFPEVMETIRCVHVSGVETSNDLWAALEKLENDLGSRLQDVKQRGGGEEELLEQLQTACDAREQGFARQWSASPCTAWVSTSENSKQLASETSTEEEVQDTYSKDLKKLNSEFVTHLLESDNLGKKEIDKLLADHRDQQHKRYQLMLSQKQALDAKLRDKLQHKFNCRGENQNEAGDARGTIPIVSSLGDTNTSIHEESPGLPSFRDTQHKPMLMRIESCDEKELSFTAVEEECVQVHVSRAHAWNSNRGSEQTQGLGAVNEESEEGNLFLISAPFLSDNLFQPSDNHPKSKHLLEREGEPERDIVLEELDKNTSVNEDTTVHIGVDELPEMAAQTEDALLAHAWKVLGQKGETELVCSGGIGDKIKLPKTKVKSGDSSSSSDDSSLDSEEEELLEQYTQHLNDTLDQEAKIVGSRAPPTEEPDETSETSTEDDEDELAQTTLLNVNLTSTLKNIKDNLQTLTVDDFKTLMASFRRDADAPDEKNLPGKDHKDPPEIPLTNNNGQAGKQSDPDLGQLQATIREDIDAGFNDIHKSDAGFSSTLKAGREMDQAEFEAMMQRHLEDVDALRHLRDQARADHEKRIQQRLQRRSKQSPGSRHITSGSESSSDEDTTSQDDLYSPDPAIQEALVVLKKKYLEDLNKRKDMLSKEELDKILRQYREEQKNLIQSRQAERARTNDKLKKKLMARQRRKKEKERQESEKKKGENENESREEKKIEMSSTFTLGSTEDDRLTPPTETGLSDMQKRIQLMDEEFYRDLMSKQLRDNIPDEELERLVEQHVLKVEMFRKRLERMVQARRKLLQTESRIKQKKELTEEEQKSAAAAVESLVQLQKDRDEQARQLRHLERNRMNDKLLQKLANKRKKKLGSTIRKSPPKEKKESPC